MKPNKRPFLRWVNILIAKHPNGLEKIQNLVESIRDGVTLGRIAEVLIPTTLRLKQPVANDLQRTQNISLALDAIEKNGCKLINIHPAAIIRGDTKTILGLMFQLCIRYQVSSPQEAEEDGTKKAQMSVMQLKLQLVEWINSQLATLHPEDNLALRALIQTDVYSEEPLICSDLEKSLKDGGVLVGLIAALSAPHGRQIIDTIQADVDQLLTTPDATLREDGVLNNASNIDLSDLGLKNHILTQSIGMRHASTLLDIPQLIDAEDMVLNPDGNTALAYYSYFKNFTRGEEPLTIVPVLKRQTSAVKHGELTNISAAFSYPDLPPNVVTLETFNPEKNYDDDVVLYI